MLRVLVFVNQTPVAEATAGNLSDLAEISDYEVRVTESGALHLDIPAKDVTGRIEGHPRKTSVWHLVQKIATLAIEESCPRSKTQTTKTNVELPQKA